MSTLRCSILCAFFALVSAGCGPTDDTQTAAVAPAKDAKAERSAQSPPQQAGKPTAPRITLESKRDTTLVKVHYPAPIEVRGCVDRVAAGDTAKAVPLCARARQLAPDDPEVRAALASLATE